MRCAAATEPAAAARDETSRLGLSFAGIHFTFEGPADALEAVGAVPLALRLRSLPGPGVVVGGFSTPGSVVAEVTCVLSSVRHAGAGAEAELAPRGLAWHSRDGAGNALTRHAEVHWRQGPEGRIYAEASLTPSPRAAESLLTAFASALLHRAGGAILHAASVELESGVVAFIGPSGAGKSTACEHVVGGRQFSLDRLAVVPATSRGAQPAGWMAHPLPGGTRSERALPDAVSLGRPLRGILAVRKATSGCEIERCTDGQAVALLRSAAFHGNRQPGAELELLTYLERLGRELPVANLHFSLGTSLGPILGRWLLNAEPGHAVHGGPSGTGERRNVGA